MQPGSSRPVRRQGRAALARGCAVGFGAMAALCSLGAPSLSQQTLGAGPLRARTGEAATPSLINRNSVRAAPVFDDQPAAADLPAAPSDDDANLDRREVDPDDPDSQVPVPGQRAVRRDGDLSDAEPQQPRDGIVDIGEPPAPADGSDPSTIDSRPIDEARLFENPRLPDDNLLFQIEELDPELDRRPQRLFRFEPFDPVGIRTGSFVLFPELEASGVFNSNVFRGARARSDIAFEVRPNARLVSNWSRHALEFRANGALSYFAEFPSEDDRAYTLETRGRIDVSRQTNLQAVLSRDVTQESRSAPDGRAAGTRADITTERALLAVNHRFNRLSLQLRGSVAEFDFSNTVNQGIVTDNGVRNYRATEEALRATWEFKPTLSAFSEVEINQRDYGRRDAAGLDRSSDGERYRVGVSFASPTRSASDRAQSPILAGEISVGYGQQRPRTFALPDVSGVILDSTLTWRPTALTAVAFNARSDFGETQTAGVGGIKNQSVGTDVRHELRRNLIATAGINTTFADYEGSALEETETRLSAGLEYFMSREAILFGRYNHVNFKSNAPAASYDLDEVRVGMRIRR